MTHTGKQLAKRFTNKPTFGKHFGANSLVHTYTLHWLQRKALSAHTGVTRLWIRRSWMFLSLLHAERCDMNGHSTGG